MSIEDRLRAQIEVTRPMFELPSAEHMRALLEDALAEIEALRKNRDDWHSAYESLRRQVLKSNSGGSP